jgi:ABC-type sugar transport system permease subunit
MLRPSIEKAEQLWRKTLPFWLLLPTIIVLLIVQVYPSMYTIWLSLRERTPKGGWDYVGMENFERLLNMGVFNESIGHTIVFLLGYSSLTLVIGYLIAQLLKRNVRFSGAYITMMFIPWVLADIIAGMVFRLLVVPDYGYLTGFLQNAALFPPDGVSIMTDTRPAAWIGEFPFPPSPSMIYLILASAWRALPFVTLLLLAALQTVPVEVIESARMDGANRLQMSRFITIPLIMPALVVALFNLTLSGMNGVGMVFSLTAGGPGTSTLVLSYLLYMIGWSRLRFGQAAALALMLAVVNWILIFGVLWITRVNQRSR